MKEGGGDRRTRTIARPKARVRAIGCASAGIRIGPRDPALGRGAAGPAHARMERIYRPGREMRCTPACDTGGAVVPHSTFAVRTRSSDFFFLARTTRAHRSLAESRPATRTPRRHQTSSRPGEGADFAVADRDLGRGLTRTRLNEKPRAVLPQLRGDSPMAESSRRRVARGDSGRRVARRL